MNHAERRRYSSPSIIFIFILSTLSITLARGNERGQLSNKMEPELECLLRFSEKVLSVHGTCLEHNEVRCGLFKANCVWRALPKQCQGISYSQCGRDAERHCRVIQIIDGPFDAIAKPRARRFVCDDTKLGQFLVPVP